MYFRNRITIRLRDLELEKIEAIVDRDSGEKYNNISHFIRCAIMKQIKEEEKNG